MISSWAFAYYQPEDISIEASKKRMSPPSELVVSGGLVDSSASPAIMTESGQAVYKQFCQVCHASGIAGAPKVGHKEQWEPRYQQGWATLMKHAMMGYKGMPAKGHCMKCSEHEIKEAIEFMLKKSHIDGVDS